jgi:hypothetical protein
LIVRPATESKAGSALVDDGRCARGLAAYRREWDEATRTFKPKPFHDWSSRGADALRTFAMGFGDDSAPTAPPSYARARRVGGGTWMAG